MLDALGAPYAPGALLAHTVPNVLVYDVPSVLDVTLDVLDALAHDVLRVPCVTYDVPDDVPGDIGVHTDAFTQNG